MYSRLIFFGGMLLLFVAVGCGSDSSSGPNDSGGQDPMSARIDGTDWSAAVPLATIASANIVAVSGASGGGTISFGLQFVEGKDTYIVGTDNANAHLYIGSNAWSAPAGGTIENPDGTSGTITVTSLTEERIKGTFSFTLKTVQAGTTPVMRTVTDGAFDVEFNSWE